MKTRRVRFSPEFITDVQNMHLSIAASAGSLVADRFIDRLENYLSGFDLASERGTRREDIRPGLRIIGFERRLTIAFTVSTKEVMVLRVFWGGQNWEKLLQ